MKQKELIKRLEKAGFQLVRHGVAMKYIKQEAMKNKFQDTGKLTKD